MENGKEDKQPEKTDELRQFEENPYSPDRVKPEDVVRIFYEHNTPLIPVISNRNILLGVLKKEDVVAELSDIERVKNQKIDAFISKVYRKMGLDELLPYVASNSVFVTINLFGEVQGQWTRLELLAASEKGFAGKSAEREAAEQREEHVLEWMIYCILEHIPRALYAVNEKGKTIFFNSHFEELVKANTGKEIDIDAVEKALSSADVNEFFYSTNADDVFFYNKELDFYYEKIPLKNNDATIGFLIYCSRGLNEASQAVLPQIETKRRSLDQMLDAYVRKILVDAVKEHGYNLDAIAAELRISKNSLLKKIQKYRISVDREDTTKQE